jgi:hypothetical protein
MAESSPAANPGPSDARASWRERAVPGFLLCALAGLLYTIVGTNEVVKGVAATTRQAQTLRFGNSTILIGGLMIVVFGLLAAFGRRPGLRIAGLTVALSGALFPALDVIRARVDTRLAKDTTVELLGSGKLTIAAAALCLVGFVAALRSPEWDQGENRNPARAILLSAAGTLFFPLAAVGIGLGMLGRRSDVERTRMQSTGAVVVGFVAVVGWSILVFVGALVLHR